MADDAARGGFARRAGLYLGLLRPRPGEQPGRLSRSLTLTEASTRSDAVRVLLVNALLVVLIGGRALREDGGLRLLFGFAALVLVGGLVRIAVMYPRLRR